MSLVFTDSSHFYQMCITRNGHEYAPVYHSLLWVLLHLMPHVLQGAWWSQGWHHVVAFSNKCWTRSFALGYWLFISLVFLNQMRKKTFAGIRLSQVSMYVAFFTLALIGDSRFFVTVGSFIVLNQLIAGSIMVRHMKLIRVLSLPLRVYYLMRCTHNARWGVIMTSFDSTWPYQGCVSCFWQDLQDLMLLDGMCIRFQYITDFCCLFETWVARVLKVTVVPTDCPVL